MASEPVNTIDQQFAELKTDFIQLKKEFANLQTAHTSLVRKVRASGAGVLIISCICLLSNSLPTALAQGYGTTLRSILQRISALETAQKTTTTAIASLTGNVTTLNTKTKYLTTGIDRNGYPASYFTACNVYIQDGLGSTSGIPNDPLDFGLSEPHTNGLGNLIIGYNEPSSFVTQNGGNLVEDQYTGSHNLVLGGGNQYSSFGAIVGGAVNYSDAPYGSILNGNLNECSGPVSTVVGGNANLASGPFGSVLGGAGNSATNNADTVSGGDGNVASGGNSTVSGGAGIKETSLNGWAGGTYHTP